jgi:histidinol-phosphate aminotransferase
MELEGMRTRADKQVQEHNKALLDMQSLVSRFEQKKLAADMEEKQLLDKPWDSYELSHSAAQQLRKPIESQVAEIVAGRERLAAWLPSLPFVRKVFPSEANFLLVKVDDADALYAHLLRDGIIVRNRSRVPGCEGSLRITVGTPEENEKLISSLERFAL